ncbi:MAG: hypothetical protein K0U37_00620 [Gammaproteobacteria bacterium]|nr:hypothetical protein [Gammaproteobacteria bacterium]
MKHRWLKVLKKIATLMCLLASGSLFSGSMGPVDESTNVVIPMETHGFSVGAKALYLQPTWDYLNAPLYTINNGVDTLIKTNTAWNWGFMVEGAYRFASARDINLNWYHIKSSHSLVVNGSIGSAILDVLSPGPTSIKNSPTWDAVNLEFGQDVDYGKSLDIRYHGGVEYVHLIFGRTIYAAPVPPNSGLQSTYRSYAYNGFGPRAGLDAAYHFEHGLLAYIKGATGLYAGTSRYFMQPNNTPRERTTRIGESMNIVPELEAKLGVTYTYSNIHGDLSLDGGWLWINYFNSIMDADDDKVHVANFGFQGPYLGLKWAGNLA